MEYQASIRLPRKAMSVTGLQGKHLSDNFSLYIKDLLSAHGGIVVKRMFGGHGVYCDGLFIAILSGETLYFKADETSRQAFENADCARFSYSRAGKTATLGFYEAPADAMESSILIRPWMRLALQAALGARERKRPTMKGSTSTRTAARKLARCPSA